MKKYTLFSFVFVCILLFTLLGFNVTASADNCAPGDNYHSMTGLRCDSVTTQEGNLPVGCADPRPKQMFSTAIANTPCLYITSSSQIQPFVTLISTHINTVASSDGYNVQANGAFKFRVYSPLEAIFISRVNPLVKVMFSNTPIGNPKAVALTASGNSNSDAVNSFFIGKGESRTFELSFIVEPTNGTGLYSVQALALQQDYKINAINFGNEFITNYVTLGGATTVQPSITVTKPSEGEKLTVDQEYIIEYKTYNIPVETRVNLSLSYVTNQGVTYEDSIVTNDTFSYNGGPNFYRWVIPAKYATMRSELFKIRAVLVGPNISSTNRPQDYSDYFTINLPTPAQPVTVTLETDKSEYKIGETVVFKAYVKKSDRTVFTPEEGAIVYIRQYSSSANIDDNDIMTFNRTGGYYEMRANDHTGTRDIGSWTAWVNVSRNNLATGNSPTVFYRVSAVSQPSITVSIPNKGEAWQPGEKETVRWTSSGISQYETVTLRLLNSARSVVAHLAENTQNDGIEQIFVPTTIPAGSYQLEVNWTKVGVPAVAGSSDYFTITAPIVIKYTDSQIISYLEQAARNRTKSRSSTLTEEDFDVDNDRIVNATDEIKIRNILTIADTEFDLAYKRISRIVDLQIGKTKTDSTFIDELDVDRNGTISASDKTDILRAIKGSRVYPQVVQVPTISSVSPLTIRVGTQLDVSGSGFNTASANTATFRNVSTGLTGTYGNVAPSSSLTRVTVPSNLVPGTYDMTINNGSAVSDSFRLTIQEIPPPLIINPSISYLSTNSGKVGSAVTIYGSAFNVSANNTVKFTNVSTGAVGTYSSVGYPNSSGSYIQANIPSGLSAGVYDVTVNSNNGSVTSGAVRFTIEADIVVTPPTSSVTLSFSLNAGSTEDRAGAWNNFGPGVGFGGGSQNQSVDWSWTANLSLPNSATISSVKMSHTGQGEYWSTDGATDYPLVLVDGVYGTQMNSYLGQTLYLGAGNHTIKIYGQKESQTFSGSTLTIKFADGTSVSATIQSSGVAGDLFFKIASPTGRNFNSGSLAANVIGATTSNNSTTTNVTGLAKFRFTQFLEERSYGNEVRELQKFLNKTGYDIGKIDGIFGSKVKEAVIKFQNDNKLKADGIVGYEMRTVLNSF